MDTIKIDILNPKVNKLLQDLADMDLIAIRKPSTASFSSVLKDLRKESHSAPSLEEILAEVELVRTKRNDK